MHRALPLCIALSACNAFPDELRGRFQEGGTPPSPPSDAGQAGVAEGRLIVGDTGSHRGLAVVSVADADWLAWSSGASERIRIRYCKADGCGEPREFEFRVCDSGGDPEPVTGFIVASGSRILVTQTRCPGWLCGFDPSQNDAFCGYGSGYRRLFGDANGVFGTGTNPSGTREVAIHAFDPASLKGGNLTETGHIAVDDLAQEGESIAVSPTRLFITVVPTPGAFRVLACPRALATCTTPAEVVPTRPGVVAGLAATDTHLFVAVSNGLENQLLRIEIASRQETVLAKTASSIGGLLVAGEFVYWSEDATVTRAPIESGAPARIAKVPSPISHLASPPSEPTSLYALARTGLYAIPVPRP